MTDRDDYPLRTLRLCDSALKSQHCDGIPLRVEASACDQLIRHARALSGLRPAPPPFVYFVVNPPRRICRAARVYGKRGDLV